MRRDDPRYISAILLGIIAVSLISILFVLAMCVVGAFSFHMIVEKG